MAILKFIVPSWEEHPTYGRNEMVLQFGGESDPEEYEFIEYEWENPEWGNIPAHKDRHSYRIKNGTLIYKVERYEHAPYIVHDTGKPRFVLFAAKSVIEKRAVIEDCWKFSRYILPNWSI